MKNDERPFPPHEPIPGERDPGNLTKREPGGMGGRFAGEDIPASSHLPWLDDVTASEHAHEGGLPANKTSIDDTRSARRVRRERIHRRHGGTETHEVLNHEEREDHEDREELRAVRLAAEGGLPLRASP